ncbi:MAG: phospho-N-acetylmuramoyl-pentapeptide-transferase [Anaerolineae bacterium]|nr:phospho-N-acetylmuramoyl-pentapeptide-transferase [Anaerolineae bacterium]
MAPELLLSGLVFLLMVPWGGWVIQQLVARGIGKRIRTEEPDAHQVKSGTATMGGLYFLVGMVGVSLVLALLGFTDALLILLAVVAFGVLGAFDDLRGLHDRSGVGWLARYKFFWQWVLALGVAIVLYLAQGSHPLRIPIVNASFELKAWSIPLQALLLVFMSNAVNLTDGLDGLAGGSAASAYAALGILAMATGQRGVSLFSFGMVGALAAFLWYNVHPARVFMGDIGAQALGAGLAAAAGLAGHWLLLPLIGLVFVLESLSVMLQVSYFKYTRIKHGEGRRILRMSPLHYHFELGGWSETQIVARFWIVAAVVAAFGVALGTV